MVVAENGEGQFDTKTTLNLVNGQEEVALPTDFYEARAVYRVCNGYNQIMSYNNNLTSGYDTSNGASGDSYVPDYYFRENNLVLRPAPGFNETGGLVLEYTAFPETLIIGGDVMVSGISPIFKELVVKYICYQAKLKESSVRGGDTYLPVERHLAVLFEQFKRSVDNRSKYPQAIVPFDP